jgi:hypothetical protein
LSDRNAATNFVNTATRCLSMPSACKRSTAIRLNGTAYDHGKKLTLRSKTSVHVSKIYTNICCDVWEGRLILPSASRNAASER